MGAHTADKSTRHPLHRKTAQAMISLLLAGLCASVSYGAERSTPALQAAALHSVTTPRPVHNNKNELRQRISRLKKEYVQTINALNDINERLSDARVRGDIRKITYYERKLNQKRAVLRQLQFQLNEAQAELAILRNQN